MKLTEKISNILEGSSLPKVISKKAIKEYKDYVKKNYADRIEALGKQYGKINETKLLNYLTNEFIGLSIDTLLDGDEHSSAISFDSIGSSYKEGIKKGWFEEDEEYMEGDNYFDTVVGKSNDWNSDIANNSTAVPAPKIKSWIKKHEYDFFAKSKIKDEMEKEYEKTKLIPTQEFYEGVVYMHLDKILGDPVDDWIISSFEEWEDDAEDTLKGLRIIWKTK